MMLVVLNEGLTDDDEGPDGRELLLVEHVEDQDAATHL